MQLIGEVGAKRRLVPIRKQWDPSPGTICTIARPRYCMLCSERSDM